MGSLCDDTFYSRIGLCAIGEHESALSVYMAKAGVVFCEMQLACPLRIGIERFLQTESQLVDGERLLVEPDGCTGTEVGHRGIHY